VLDGCSDSVVVVVVVVVWVSETTASEVVLEAICEDCWGSSEIIAYVIVSEAV